MNDNKLEVEAKIENLQQVLDFVNEKLERQNCSNKTMVQLAIAIEEIFVNIASYAYPETSGNAAILTEVKEEEPTVVITFIDNGIPYNPLGKQDPDVTLSAEERTIGGLGIYMVKKSMDHVSYEYKEGQNILKITKNL